MNNFVRRAFDKADKLSPDEIKTLIRYLASENEILKAILDKIELGIVVLSKSARVLACNEASRHLLPLTRKMSGGSSIRHVISDPDITSFLLGALETNGDEKKTKEFDLQYGDKVRTLSISVSTFTSELDPLVWHDSGKRYLFIIEDISEEKRQEALLHRSESLASITTVAAGVAHEIKNPLASIGIHLQLLRKAFQRKTTLSLDDAKRYLDVIEEEIDRLNSIVVDFLFAVRPMDVRLRLAPINVIIEDVCKFVQYELESHRIVIKKQLGEYLPKLAVDENLIKQVLLNIIKNSMNAMEAIGGVLTIGTKLEGNHVLITISDTGIGMDEQTMAKIFEPFFTTKSTGSGLGLTMVFKVVKEHHGDISVSSRLGEGTTFTISLPVPTSERLVLEASHGAYDTGS